MTDVIVVGAGIVGMAAAYEITRAGHSVTLVDAGHAGGATDAGAGIVNPLDLSPDPAPAEDERIALDGPDAYTTLVEHLAADGQDGHGFARVGQLVVATNDRESAALDRLADRFRADLGASLQKYFGPPQELSAAEVTGRVPYLAPDLRALLLPGVARVDGRRLSRALDTAVHARGAKRLHGVAALRTRSGRAVGVEVEGRRICAGRIIMATGSWIGPDRPLAPLAGAVRPSRGQIVHLSHPGAADGTTPIASRIGGPYILTFDPDRVVTGATHEDVGHEYRTTAGGLAEVLDEALSFAPGLHAATYLETRVGFRPVSSDGLPLVGPVPGADGVFIGTGLGAHGLTLGPAIGAILARLALDADPGIDLRALRPDRFLHSTRLGGHQA